MIACAAVRAPTTALGERLRTDRSAPCIAFDLEERVRKRDRRQILRHGRIDDEHDGHLPRLAGCERLPREAEAVQLAEILGGVAWAVTRNRLARDGLATRVDHLEHDLRHRAGMDVGRRLQRAELPRHVVQVRVEFDPDHARRVDLRVDDRIRLVDVAQAGHFADLLVEGHERVAEPEHRHDDDAELREQHAVVTPDLRAAILRERSAAHRRRWRPIATIRYSSTAPPMTPVDTTGLSMKRDAMMPTKNNSAIAASNRPVRRLAAFRRAA